MSDPNNNGMKDGPWDLDLLHNAGYSRSVLDYQSDDVDEESCPELLECVMPYGSVMGFCDKKFGVLAADSRQIYEHENHTSDTTMKVVKVTSHIGMVGLGSEHIISKVKKRIEDFDPNDEFAFTMKDVADSIGSIITECIEEATSVNSGTDQSVFYIVLGKMNNGFEMYSLTNDSGRVFVSRVHTRLVNGGSGHKALATYQNENPLDIWVTETEAIVFCSKCMTHAVMEDRVHSGGDINMVLINDDKYRSFVFRKSDVYGYCLAPELST